MRADGATTGKDSTSWRPIARARLPGCPVIAGVALSVVGGISFPTNRTDECQSASSSRGASITSWPCRSYAVVAAMPMNMATEIGAFGKAIVLDPVPRDQGLTRLSRRQSQGGSDTIMKMRPMRPSKFEATCLELNNHIGRWGSTSQWQGRQPELPREGRGETRQDAQRDRH